MEKESVLFRILERKPTGGIEIYGPRYKCACAYTELAPMVMVAEKSSDLHSTSWTGDLLLAWSLGLAGQEENPGEKVAKSRVGPY